MKVERTKVEYPLWRKKVDKSLFQQGTTIPNWVCKIWSMKKLYAGISNKKDERARVLIHFKDKKYSGAVTEAAQGRATPAYRLWIEEDLVVSLRDTFLMSYMRALEDGLSGKRQKEDIEERIPFWKFLILNSI